MYASSTLGPHKTLLFCSMASLHSVHCSLSLPPVTKRLNLNHIQPIPTNFRYPKTFSSRRSLRTRATASPSSSSATVSTTQEEERQQQADETAMSIDNLHRFFDLNMGKWTGSFHQFDANGRLLHKISTKLSVSSYGEDDLISLIQTLYIKQPVSTTSVSGDNEEPEWAEYKIKETNMFTVDKYQHIGFFPNERAFALRYQTAGMLENILRQGVLGEDDTEEESPKNLKLPSLRPSIVCENCLYLGKDLRARVFHIMDPKGVLEMLLIFLEERGNGVVSHPSLDDSVEDTNRVIPFLGNWKGHSITKRSGVYGATIAEADTNALLEMDDSGQLIQDIYTTVKGNDVTTNVRWTGTMSDNLITFDGGYQITLLPGGMYMGCPSDVAKSIQEFNSFHLEFCWLEGPGKRQRLVRTFDAEGMAVSSTYFSEIKM